MLGRTLYTSSCDAGARRTFTNVVGNPIRVWDNLDHVVRSVYDVLHRRTELRVRTGAAAEVLAEQTIYGETLATPATTNHRGKVYQVKDGAGVMTSVSYDFKGNLLLSQRQLAQTYITQLDWSAAVPLELETFSQTTAYDALNRPTSITMPDTSELKPTYNEAGLLEKVQARIRNAATWTTFVDDIDYDAKGQRERIVYGNGVITEYEYDEFTFRVKRIKTTRASDNKILQDLRYTYDAVGNIVEMADLAYATFFHAGQEIKPVWQYEYDALYRLTYTNGREHAGQQANIQQDENGFPLVNTPNPNDPSAMRMYTETYHYDAVGNILKMVHDAQSNTGDWTRFYHVAATSNRLLDTSLPGNNELDPVYSATYLHDAHGNMTKMPHVAQMDWDFKDQMQRVYIANNQDVYFTYDASGQRVRKVWVHQNIVEERIYLGGYEVYRKHQSNSIRLERQTLHIMDDTRRIAMVETKTIDTSGPAFTPAPRLRYQCSNHLGSAMLELDEAGLVISYEEYHPYGTSAYRAMKNNVDVSAKRYRYTGKERDEETGLYYHGARYYACWLARWTSADPAGMVDGVNLFQYVRGRPIGSSDPTGTMIEGNQETLTFWKAYKQEIQARYTSAQAELASASRGPDRERYHAALSRLNHLGYAIEDAKRIEASDEAYLIEFDSSLSSRGMGKYTVAAAVFGIGRRDEAKGNTVDNLVLKIRINPGLPEAERFAKLAHELVHADDYERGREAVVIPRTPAEQDAIEARAKANPKEKVKIIADTRDVFDEVRGTRREQGAFGSYQGQTIDVDWVTKNYPDDLATKTNDVSGNDKMGNSIFTRRELYTKALQKMTGPVPGQTPVFKGWRNAMQRAREIQP